MPLGVGWFFVLVTRSLENMVDRLGVGNPQAIFLYDRVSITLAHSAAPKDELAYTKCPVPASYGSVFFQEPLLNGTPPFALPPPHMACHRICEIIDLRCAVDRATIYPGWVLRSWDVADRGSAIAFKPDINHCGSTEGCYRRLLGVHLGGL